MTNQNKKPIAEMTTFDLDHFIAIETDIWHANVDSGQHTLDFMLNNKIGLSPCIMQPDNDFEEPCELWVAECGDTHAYHKNPHRAVAEVFLMLRGYA